MPPRRKKRNVQYVRPERYNKHLRLTTATCDTSAGAQSETLDDKVTDNENFAVEDIINSLTSQNCTSNRNNKEFGDENNIQEAEQSKNLPEIAQESAENSSSDNSFIEDLIAQVLYHHDESEVNENDDNGLDSEADTDTENELENSEETPFVDFDDGKESGEEPIYYGHSMPVKISMLLILLYCVTHGVSGSQLDDLLTLIGIHCLEAHPGLKSLFHFKKYFANIKSPLVKHYYCTHCLTFLDTTMEACPNQLCKKNLKDMKAKSYFLEIPIESQLRTFFNRPGFTDHLTSRFKGKQSENIEDIYDGKIYKNMSVDGGPLSESNPYNISFTLNTDGVPIFKSSKFSIWPVYLMINELPFKIRKQSENMIFCGLWFGDVKPFMATFSQPLHKSLKKLEEDGISITTGEENITCKAFLICVTADLPARSILLNMNQFNGAFCCVYCLEKGKTFQTKKKGSVHIFPFNTEQPQGYVRTHDGSVSDAVKAVNTRSTVQGIKGPSFLMCLNSFDFVKGTCIDYMHGTLLGITKLLINLWISPSYSKEDFSVASFSEVIDSRLLQIKPPAFITRVPRSIGSHFKYWKASELRSWLLFYSVPVLQGILHENYLFHYSAFVQAIHCLSGNSISSISLDHAEKLLTYFVLTFPALYGERYQTLNLHSLLHLSECVRNLGPLWAYSCFPFETTNGYVTRLFHGTQHVDMQIISSVNIIQMLPELISSVPQKYHGLVQKFYTTRISKRVCSFHIQFLGKGFNTVLTEQESAQVLTLLNFEPANLIMYNRVILRGELFHSKNYSKVKKRNSYTVKFFCPSTNLFLYGFVRYFGNHIGVLNSKSFAFVHVLKNTKSTMQQFQNKDLHMLGISLPHIHLCEPSNEFKVIELHNLIGVCVCVEFLQSNFVYVCDTPNKIETD